MKCLRTLLCSLMMVIFAISCQQASAQNKKVNDPCTSNEDCGNGLRCLTLRNQTRVCGTCSQDRLNTLSGIVDRDCKNKEEMTASIADQGEMSMAEIETKIDLCKACIEARKAVISDCFTGNPDPDHVKKLQEYEGILSRNIEIKDKMTSYRRAYYCTKSDYDNYQRYVEEYCSKNFDRAYDDANRRKQEKGGCSDLGNWVSSCQKCVESYNEFKRNAFRGQMSGKREEELRNYANRLNDLKGVLDYKKSNNLCE